MFQDAKNQLVLFVITFVASVAFSAVHAISDYSCRSTFSDPITSKLLAIGNSLKRHTTEDMQKIDERIHELITSDGEPTLDLYNTKNGVEIPTIYNQKESGYKLLLSRRRQGAPRILITISSPASLMPEFDLNPAPIEEVFSHLPIDTWKIIEHVSQVTGGGIHLLMAYNGVEQFLKKLRHRQIMFPRHAITFKLARKYVESYGAGIDRLVDLHRSSESQLAMMGLHQDRAGKYIEVVKDIEIDVTFVTGTEIFSVITLANEVFVPIAL